MRELPAHCAAKATSVGMLLWTTFLMHFGVLWDPNYVGEGEREEGVCLVGAYVGAHAEETRGSC